MTSLVILILLILPGCGGAKEAEPTQPAPAEVIPPTNTTAPTDIPLPTSTFTPVPTDTPVPTETSVPTDTPDLAATEAAEATAAAEELTAKIDAELQKLGLSTSEGYLAWTQTDPLSVTTDVGAQTLFAPFAEGQKFSDFILGADVTWESTSGLAGCGFMFRSEENFERGAQYRFYTIRLSGLPLWDIEYWKFGEWQTTLGGEPRSNTIIDQANGATNRYVLHITKDLFTSFANGERLGRVTSSTLKEGYFALFTFQESQKSTCTMNNAWIWALK